jgi:hypothetical protein
VAILLLLVGTGAGVARAADDGPVRPAVESEFLQLANAERAAHGLAPLSPAADIVAVARDHAMRMARAEQIFHNPRLTVEVDDWEIVGENVGTGPGTAEIHRALMASPTHRAQLLKPQYTDAGFGVVERDSRLYLTQVFRLPMATATVDPAPPEPVSVPEPAPAPVAERAEEEPVVVVEVEDRRAEPVALFDAAVLDGSVSRDVTLAAHRIDASPVVAVSAVPDLPAPAPLAASLAALLIALVVGAQGLAARRLGLV